MTQLRIETRPGAISFGRNEDELYGPYGGAQNNFGPTICWAFLEIWKLGAILLYILLR